MCVCIYRVASYKQLDFELNASLMHEILENVPGGVVIDG